MADVGRSLEADRDTALEGCPEAPPSAGPCALVIFGAAGDLTRRLLFPALYNLAREQLLPEAFAIVGMARTAITEDALRARIAESVAASGQMPDAETTAWLARRLRYVRSGFDEESGYRALAGVLDEVAARFGTERHHLYYLATAPEAFLGIANGLAGAGLLDESGGGWRRLVVEKPFGRDVESARALNRALLAVADERQIFRIDHYLGKETVQNLVVFRFGNGIFEPVWNRRYVDHVQITVAETVGVETRGGYYDHTGALRDMVPNHLLQLLTLTAMEPPATLDADALQDEQRKVLQAVAPLDPAACGTCTVRGQYARGQMDGAPAPAYRDEPAVDPGSTTETYAALRLFMDNWRWAGVPFYLRTGKRLRAKRTEVVIQFRRAPLALFRHASMTRPDANQLVISVQPEESIALRFAAKVPGPTVTARPVRMRFLYEDYFGRRVRTGYETLLYDAMTGDRSLFRRADVIEAGWKVVQPVIDAWAADGEDLATYAAGSDGPEAAGALIETDCRAWRRL